MADHRRAVTSSNVLISNRLRRWYEGGRKGLQTICEAEGAPDAVKDQVQHWFDQGDMRLKAIIEEIQKLEKNPPGEPQSPNTEYTSGATRQ